MNRRELFALTAATAAGAMAASRLDPARIRTRKAGKVEIVFDSPGPAPNGLQATREGLWIIDQGAGNKAYLVTYEGGKVLRSFETETDKSSGITFDGDTLWIGSTYSREIVRCRADDGQNDRASLYSGCGRDLQDVRRSSGAEQSAGEVQAEARGAGSRRDRWADFRPARCSAPRHSAPARMDRSGGTASCGSPCRPRARSIAWIRRRGRSKRNFRPPATGRTESAGKASFFG